MVRRILFPHQHRALEYAKNRSRIALFMEMRLGKSLVAIRWAEQHRLDRVLVIGPLSVMGPWREELYADGVGRGDIHLLTEGSTLERLVAAEEIDTGWALLNYETARIQPRILLLPWSGIILDESTRIRNPKAQITKRLLTQSAHIVHRAILSGLPAPESPLDYFCQMAFLYGGFMNCFNFWAFRQRYFYPDTRGWEWQPKSDTVNLIKHEVHTTAFVLTRKAAGMGNKKLYEKRVVPMTTEQTRLYKQVSEKFEFTDPNGEELSSIETQWAVTKELWLARLAGGFSPDRDHPRLINDAKLKELDVLLTGDLLNEKVVVWFRFNEELFAADALLTKLQIPHTTLTGATPVADRLSMQDTFRTPALRVILAQEAVGKFGINLSAASTAIYYSNLYEYEARAQSEDRIEHPSKHEPLLYIDLVTQGTIDEHVINVLRDKKVVGKTFMAQLMTRMKAEYLKSVGRAYESSSNPAPRRVMPGDKS